ncbi:MAG: ABC transporter substrate-binding protein [Rhodocyclaceae bacterium]|nr:ABC transporter substrate-binding protein [Rhodocyclaceae bacterium]
MRSRALRSLLICLAMIFSCGLFAAEKLHVTFINPGKSDEAYWMMVTAFMKAAAEDLGITLEVLYVERNHFMQSQMAREIAARPNKPDYVVLVNEKLVAPETIKPLDDAGIKTFLIFNDLSDEQKLTHGIPRSKYKHWLGTMTPNNVDAGYKIARYLFAEAKKRGMEAPELLAISGNRVTPASTERKSGLDRALMETDLEVKLTQEIWGEFEEIKAYEMTKRGLLRYPNLKIIWAANDPMAMGAMRAAREAGKTPGKDILFGGLNWSTAALKAVKSNEMVVTVGGHFMTGGWSLVAIYDHAHGIDFAADNGTEIKPEVFGAIDATNVDSYTRAFGEGNWSKLDFSRFSRKYNPKIRKYDFSLTSVMNSLRQ